MIAYEINSVYGSAQQPFSVDPESSYIIIDVDNAKVSSVIEVSFYKGQLYSIHIEDWEQGSEKNFSRTRVTHLVKYYYEE